MNECKMNECKNEQSQYIEVSATFKLRGGDIIESEQ